MEYTIWVEGYSATGEHGTAKVLARVDAHTFDAAVEKWAKNTHDPDLHGELKMVDGQWFLWGCQLFGNEARARERFG